MPIFNLHNRQFRLLENSEHGAVSNQTTFIYSQEGSLVTAVYVRGGVKEGQIIATFRSDDHLEMRYHCIMDDLSLKAWKTSAEVILNYDGLIELHLNWQWLGDSREKRAKRICGNCGRDPYRIGARWQCLYNKF